MIKKQVYPKTKRVKVKNEKICQLTEKLDGSNLCIFKKDDILYIAQRNNIYSINELEDVKDTMYKGLYKWINEYKDYLLENLQPNSCICGEWLGMGCLKYDSKEFDKKFYMFAKANINDQFELFNIYYYHELFIYPFVNQEIPDFIGVVPIVSELYVLPNKNDLDDIYDYYRSCKNRDVEGIIVNYNNNISKYVRMKNGQLQEHFDRGE